MYVHALHTVHALPDLRVAAGRLRDGVSHLIGGLSSTGRSRRRTLIDRPRVDRHSGSFRPYRDKCSALPYPWLTLFKSTSTKFPKKTSQRMGVDRDYFVSNRSGTAGPSSSQVLGHIWFVTCPLQSTHQSFGPSTSIKDRQQTHHISFR